MPDVFIGVGEGWHAVSLADATADLTAAGAMFEMQQVDLNGHPGRAWRNGPQTLSDVFEAARSYGSKTFLVYETERVSFEGFTRAAQTLAAYLVFAGVEPGDRVVIAMSNLPEWPVSFYAVILAGAVAVPLNAWGTSDELVFALIDSGAVVAILDAERLQRLSDRLSGLPALRRILVCRRAGMVDPDRVTDLESVIDRPPAWGELPASDVLARPRKPEDLATLFYTSGTTGSPKGAPANHRAATTAVLSTLFSQARAYLRRGEAMPALSADAPQKAYVVSIPFFHVTGCFALLNVAMAAGMKLVLMPRFDPEGVLALVKREGVTAVGGVPTIAWRLLEQSARGDYDLTTLEAVTYGGAPAAPELVRRLQTAWPKALPSTGWGMTETSATFTHHVGEDYLAHPQSCGLPSPINDMKVVDPEGRTLPSGAAGEIWVRGPGVISGYWNRPEASATAFQDGWLKTGDIGKIDEDGFCYIVDRLKDVVIRGGENIYSVEVESVLYEHPDVMDAAVLAITHPTLGEEPAAVVTLRSGANSDEAELKAHVRARLAAYKTPVRVLISAQPLPRNASGKIIKVALKTLFADPDAIS